MELFRIFRFQNQTTAYCLNGGKRIAYFMGHAHDCFLHRRCFLQVSQILVLIEQGLHFGADTFVPQFILITDSRLRVRLFYIQYLKGRSVMIGIVEKKGIGFLVSPKS
jgi:hypothetical protein